MNNLKESVQKLDYESRHFIGEAINMFKLNFDSFEIDINPTTKKAFYLLATVNNVSIEKHFTAAEVKGVKGIYKLASMIARL